MANNRFRRRVIRIKNVPCSCGGQAKLSKRRNFPHGRKSGGISYTFYRCKSCNKEIPLNRQQEVRR